MCVYGGGGVRVRVCVCVCVCMCVVLFSGLLYMLSSLVVDAICLFVCLFAFCLLLLLLFVDCYLLFRFGVFPVFVLSTDTYLFL